MGESRSSWVDPAAHEVAAADLQPMLGWLDTLPFAPNECVLAGWSQGTNIAYSVAFGTGGRRTAAAVALGGRLSRQVQLDLTAPLPPIFIAHGQNDESTPPAGTARRGSLSRSLIQILHLGASPSTHTATSGSPDRSSVRRHATEPSSIGIDATLVDELVMAH